MITSYDDLTISQRDRISEIINDKTKTDVEKDDAILLVLGFDSNKHNFSNTAKAIEKAKFLLKPCPVTKLKTFKYGGYTFKMPRVTQITYAQYVDMCNSHDNVGMLRAICVPEGHSYNDGYDLDFSNLPYPIAASIIDPFVQSWLRRSLSSLHSLVSIMKVRTIFSKRYRRRVSSILSTFGSISSSLSTTRWV